VPRDLEDAVAVVWTLTVVEQRSGDGDPPRFVDRQVNRRRSA
jgi:hypothetical protein